MAVVQGDLFKPSPSAMTEEELAALALALGAGASPAVALYGLDALATGQTKAFARSSLNALRDQIRSGHDPLGEAFCCIRSPETRRSKGAVYTPSPIVTAMLVEVAGKGEPGRIVDAGTGSARFLLHAGRVFPKSELVGVEYDPLAALVACANLAVAGFARRARVVVDDYRNLVLEPIKGKTLHIGNPPYVRHHQISVPWKKWLVKRSSALGIQASALAGLHAHFYLALAELAVAGDFGAFITSAEWLDVNYGRLIRELFLRHLGGERLVLIEPTAEPFPGTMTTGAIAYFEVGACSKTIAVRRVAKVAALNNSAKDTRINRERFASSARWSHLTRLVEKPEPGYVQLGELCRVHRGQVTGANRVWIHGPHSEGLPEVFLFPTVTRARELYAAGTVLDDPMSLRRVIDLPAELDDLDKTDRKKVDVFLREARKMDADKGYIARNRRAWWAVELREPAPILATYMARRPPAFVRNVAGAKNINTSHGLYPREEMSEALLAGLVRYLSNRITLAQGRTYAGGLTKFEPREMERIYVPSPEMLESVEGI